MKEKKITQYGLINSGVDRHTLNKLRHNENINVMTLARLCEILDCTPNDVLQVTKDP